MFINELRVYVDHLKREISKRIDALTARGGAEVPSVVQAKPS
jgi:hypothetical protein